MADWLPYLERLYPEIPRAQEKIDELLRHRTALTAPRLSPDDRIRILEWFDDQPVPQQLFVLPELALLLANPSRPVRARLLDLCDDLIGHTQPALIAELARVGTSPTPESIDACRRSLAALLAREKIAPGLPFSAIAAIRLPVFALSMLTAVEEISRSKKINVESVAADTFATSTAGTALLEILNRWLRVAPSFVRYLIVRWIDASGITVWPKHAIDAELLRVYRKDRDAIVASQALKAWSHRTEAADVPNAVKMLQREYARLPDAGRDWEPPLTPRHAVRELISGILQAICDLGIAFPVPPEPRAALSKIFHVYPAHYLNLLPGRDAVAKRQTFVAALLLRGSSLPVVLELKRDGTKATAGFGMPIRFVDPDGVAGPRPGGTYLAVAADTSSPHPTRWVFQLTEAFEKQNSHPTELPAIITPAVHYQRISTQHVRYRGTRYASAASGQRWDLRDAIEADLEVRAGLIGDGLRVARDLMNAVGGPGSLRDEDRWLIDHVWSVAVVGNVGSGEGHERQSMRGLFRHLLLAVMPSTAAFERILPNRTLEDIGQLEAALLSDILRRVPDSLPGDPAVLWITENRDLLFDLVESRGYEERVRARLAVALRNSGCCEEPRDAERLAAIHFSGQILTKYPPVLSFAPANELEALLSQSSGGRPKRPTASANYTQWVAPRAERLARALDGSWPDTSDMDLDAAICIEILALENTPTGARQELIIRQFLRAILRRVARALGAYPHELSERLRQLRDLLLRQPGSADLRAYVAARNRRGAIYDTDWTRLLVRLLDRDDAAARALRRQTTVQAIRDQLAWRDLILTELWRQADLGKRDFLRRHLDLRDLGVSVPASVHAVPVSGEVLLTGTENVSAIVTRLDDAKPLRIAADTVIPAFVHHPEHSNRFVAVAGLPRLPEEAIDFHVMRHDRAEKERIYTEALNRPSGAVVAARVLRIERGEALLETGVGQVTLRDETFKAPHGARVVVRVRRERVLRSARFDLASRGETQSTTVHDLRSSGPQSVQRLEALAGSGDVFLRARITEREEDAAAVRYQLDPGFVVGPAARRPFVRLPIRGNAPQMSDTVVVKISEPQFVEQLAVTRVAVQPRPEAVQWGTLHSFRNAWGRREWHLLAGDAKIEVPRNEITACLQTLFTLDGLADDHEVLHQLASTPVRCMVRDGKASLLNGGATYDVADVIVAASAAELSGLVFVRQEQDAFLFELAGRNRCLSAADPLPPLGALVSLRAGDLYDQKDRPFAVSRLVPGIRLKLAIEHRLYTSDGTTVAYKMPVPGSEPILCVRELDRTNIDVRESLALDQLIRIDVLSSTSARVVDVPSHLPAPAVRLEGRFAPGVVDAVVTAWNPTASQYVVAVAPPRTIRLGLREHGFSLDEWLELEPGSATFVNPYFFETKRGLMMTAAGLPVTPDWTMLWLAPDVLTAQAMNEHRPAGVLFTRITTRPAVDLPESPASDLPWLRDGEEMRGVVVAQPHPSSASREISILWEAGERTEERRYEPPASLRVPPRNADILTARRTGDVIRLAWMQRTFSGTTIFRSDRMAAANSGQRHAFTIIGRPAEGGRDTWLFVAEHATIVEIVPERLLRTDLLQGVPALSRIVLEKGREDHVWSVVEVSDGALSRAMCEPWTLELHRPRWPMLGVLTTHDATAQRRGPILQELMPENMPMRVARTGDAARRLDKQQIPCGLSYYEVYVDEIEDGYSVDIALTLTSQQVEEIGLPSLHEAVSVHGRLDGVDGRTREGNDGLVVEVLNYACKEILALPVREQTWVPRATQAALPNKTYRFAVVRDGYQLVISLRRRAPALSLEWLQKHDIRDFASVHHHPLYYCGEIGAETLVEQCGCEREDLPPGRLMLFERSAGDTLLVPLDQLRFWGLPLDPAFLVKGDLITAYQVTRTAEGGVTFDIREVVHDVISEIQSFSEGKGIFFARIGGDSGRSGIRVQGLYDARVIERRGWRVEIDGLDAAQTFADETYVYVRFVGIDERERVLRFRLIDIHAAFTPGNLVYVQSTSTEPVRYGGSFALPVAPLTGDSDERGKHIIPDTLYSVRRWRLQQTIEERGLFLARVIDNRLSLIDLPRRGVNTLLAMGEAQVIVADVGETKQTVDVEISEGVRVRAPRERFVDAAVLDKLMPGDLLFVETTSDGSRLQVRDRIPSHRTYVEVNARPTMLVELWGSLDFRHRDRQHDGRVSCNVVGLSQLKGATRVSDANIGSHDLLPQEVTGWAEKLLLDDRTGSDAAVGQLVIEANGRPSFVLRSKRRVPMPYRSVSYRRQCSAEIAAALQDWRWRDTPTRVGQTATALLIAPARSDDEMSLVDAARVPLPADHLVDQFGKMPRIGDRKSFIVAGADRERIVLEVAPGRYAELRTSMIMPAFRQTYAVATVAWEQLRAGDEIILEIAEAIQGRPHPFLPSFRVVDLRPSQWRELDAGAVVPLWRRDDGHIIAGPFGRAGIHADDYGPLTRDRIIDLRPRDHRSVEKLTAAFNRYGSQLVLEGAVAGSTRSAGRTRVFIDVGVLVEERGDMRDPSLIVDGPIPAGTPVSLRIHHLRSEQRGITECVYSLAQPFRLVRFRQGDASIIPSPEPGDIVAVYAAGRGDARVAGLEHLEIEWAYTSGDSLALHDSHRREEVLRAVLRGADELLWATIERVDPRQGVVVLSRRRQVERLLTAGNTLHRAVVCGAIGARHVLAEILGIPVTISAPDFARGLRDCNELGEALAAKQAKVEVVVDDEGAISAIAPYALPPAGEEFDTIVDHCIATGVVCRYGGLRIFIPIRELAWCWLSEEAMRAIFTPGRAVTVRGDAEGTSFSHARTGALMREARRLSEAFALTRPEIGTTLPDPDPIFVTCEYVEPNGSRAIVRSHSGLLAELRVAPNEDHQSSFLAYVVEIDARRRSIVLSATPSAVDRWAFAPLGQGAIHSWSADAIREVMAELDDAAATGAEEVARWLGGRLPVPPTFRNLRLVLECLLRRGLEPAAVLPADSVPEPNALLRCLMSSFGTAPSVETPAEAFARAYRLLQSGRAEDAEPLLKRIDEDARGHESLDVQLALARAVFAQDKYRGTLLIRMLCRRFFASAHLNLPLLLVPTQSDGPAWIKSLRNGELKQLRDKITEVLQVDPATAASRARKIWLSIVEEKVDDSAFDRTVAEYLDAVRDEQDVRQAVDPRLLALAAHLCFAAGHPARAWSFLDAMRASAPDLQLYHAWRNWMRNGDASGADPVVAAMVRVHDRALWRRVLGDADVDALWNAFRLSVYDWRLVPRTYRIVPATPANTEALEQWAHVNDMGPALAYLRDTIAPAISHTPRAVMPPESTPRPRTRSVTARSLVVR